MSKEDVPPLGPVPHKRRAIENALDVHIAMWLAEKEFRLTPSERKKLEAEKERRKRLDKTVTAGVIVGAEGVTPGQAEGLLEALETIRATEILHAWIPSKLHQAIKRIAPVQVVHDHVEHGEDAWLVRNQDIIKRSTVVVAAPKEFSEPHQKSSGVWAAIKYAKHRGVPVIIVSPGGKRT